MTGSLFFLQLGSPPAHTEHTQWLFHSALCYITRPPSSTSPLLCASDNRCAVIRGHRAGKTSTRTLTPRRGNTKVCFCLASISFNSEGSTDAAAPLICFCLIQSSVSLNVEVLFGRERWKLGKLLPTGDMSHNSGFKAQVFPPSFTKTPHKAVIYAIILTCLMSHT